MSEPDQPDKDAADDPHPVRREITTEQAEAWGRAQYQRAHRAEMRAADLEERNEELASEITALRTRMGMQATAIVERENEIAALRSRMAQLTKLLSGQGSDIHYAIEALLNSPAHAARNRAIDLLNNAENRMRGLSTPTGSDTAAPLKTEGGM